MYRQKKVAAHARAVAGIIHDTSRFVDQRPDLIAVAEYADKLAIIEAADKAMIDAAKGYIKAGLRYRDFYEEILTVWGKAGSE